MHSIVDTDVAAALDALDVAVSALFAVDHEVLTQHDRLAVLGRIEQASRRIPAATHPLVSAFVGEHVPGQFGGARAVDVLADSLRVTRAESRRRVQEADDLVPRRSMTGEPLDPVLPITSAAQHRGDIGREHVAIIRGFWDRIPAAIGADIRERAEGKLARLATQLRPDELRRAAERLMAHLDPDGSVTSDADRARRRGVQLGRQGSDLMTPGTFLLDPELRAYLDAVFAKYAAPGMCHPDDESPCAEGDPDAEAAARDARSVAQRQHDALKVMCRSMLASGRLGDHRGLPVTAVVTTTLRELEAGAGLAIGGGGSTVPMSDLIRMASHAHHYLAVFDGDGRALHLGRTKRIASRDQRIVLTAADRGCTFPGCDRPAYHAQVHHNHEWAAGGATDINELSLCCEPHHRLLGPEEEQWRAIRGPDGRTWWFPPRHVDPSQRPRTNGFHHPDDYLRE